MRACVVGWGGGLCSGALKHDRRVGDAEYVVPDVGNHLREHGPRKPLVVGTGADELPAVPDEQMAGESVLIGDEAAVQGYEAPPRAKYAVRGLEELAGLVVVEMVNETVRDDDVEVAEPELRKQLRVGAVTVERPAIAKMTAGRVNAALIRIDPDVVDLGERR